MSSKYNFLVIPLSEPVRILIFNSGYFCSRSLLMLIACFDDCDTKHILKFGSLFLNSSMSFSSPASHLAAALIMLIDLFRYMVVIPYI